MSNCNTISNTALLVILNTRQQRKQVRALIQ